MVEILKLNFDQDIDAEDSEAERRSTCGLTQKQKHKMFSRHNQTIEYELSYAFL